jgi:carbon monoxide dehydrogenase subunit G
MGFCDGGGAGGTGRVADAVEMIESDSETLLEWDVLCDGLENVVVTVRVTIELVRLITELVSCIVVEDVATMHSECVTVAD